MFEPLLWGILIVSMIGMILMTLVYIHGQILKQRERERIQETNKVPIVDYLSNKWTDTYTYINSLGMKNKNRK
jgi:hypothetical protein